MIHDIDIGILSPKSLSAKDAGEKILTRICAQLPAVAPKKYGNYEPIRTPFSMERIGDVLEHWGSRFFWKGTKYSKGSVFLETPNIHDTIAFSTSSKVADQDQLVQYLIDQSLEVNADLAYIHALFIDDPDYKDRYEMVHPFRVFLTAHELRKYLPNLPWGVIFGLPYIQMFGRERILSAPAYKVVELSESQIYLQLSERMMDETNHSAAVESVRDAVKDHLNSNAFYHPGMEYGHKYDVPIFHLHTKGQGSATAHPIDTSATLARPNIAYADEKMEEASRKILTDGTREILNYSLESLTRLQDFLDSLRSNQQPNVVPNLAIWHCGAYLGEVMRRNSDTVEYHWLDYQNAMKIQRENFEAFGESIATTAVLLGSDGVIAFPLAKVEKYLIDPSGNDLLSFAQVGISKNGMPTI